MNYEAKFPSGTELEAVLWLAYQNNKELSKKPLEFFAPLSAPVAPVEGKSKLTLVAKGNAEDKVEVTYTRVAVTELVPTTEAIELKASEWKADDIIAMVEATVADVLLAAKYRVTLPDLTPVITTQGEISGLTTVSVDVDFSGSHVLLGKLTFTVNRAEETLDDIIVNKTLNGFTKEQLTVAE